MEPHVDEAADVADSNQISKARPSHTPRTPHTSRASRLGVFLLVVGVLLGLFVAFEWDDARYVLPPSAQQLAEDARDEDLLAGMYAYGQLNEEDREKYRIMLRAFETHQKLGYPSYDLDDASRIEEHVKADHPELEDYVQFCLWEGGLLTPAYIEGFYYLGAAAQDELEIQLDAALEQCVQQVRQRAEDQAANQPLSEYDLVKAAYEWIALTTDYDAEAASQVGVMDIRESPTQPGVIADDSHIPRDYGQTVANVLLDKRAVCAGYARAFQAVMMRLGIPCVYVKGLVDAQSHAWCVVKLDGQYYQIDPTWADPQYAEGHDASFLGDIDYNFFCVTSQDMLATHVLDNQFALPDCTATACNYYVHEQLYFQQPDARRLGELVSQQGAGSKAVVIRCATREVYDDLLEGYLKTGELAEYLDDSSYRYGAADQPFLLLAVAGAW